MASDSKPTNPAFVPTLYSFYGSLLHPPALRHALKTRISSRRIVPATLSGYKMMLWGIYPTLIPSTSNADVVKGAVFMVETRAEASRLERYETGAYKAVDVEVLVKVGDEEKTVDLKEKAKVFIWGSDCARGLGEGTWSLEAYAKWDEKNYGKGEEEDRNGTEG